MVQIPPHFSGELETLKSILNKGELIKTQTKSRSEFPGKGNNFLGVKNFIFDYA